MAWLRRGGPVDACIVHGEPPKAVEIDPATVAPPAVPARPEIRIHIASEHDLIDAVRRAINGGGT